MCDILEPPRQPDRRTTPICVECGKRHVADHEDEICSECWGKMLADAHLRRIRKAAGLDAPNTAVTDAATASHPSTAAAPRHSVD